MIHFVISHSRSAHSKPSIIIGQIWWRLQMDLHSHGVSISISYRYYNNRFAYSWRKVTKITSSTRFIIVLGTQIMPLIKFQTNGESLWIISLWIFFSSIDHSATIIYYDQTVVILFASSYGDFNMIISHNIF